MKFEALKLVFFGSWCASFFVNGVKTSRTSLYLIFLLAAFGALFSAPVEAKVLSWFAGMWIGFLISSHEGKRTHSGIAQKYFMSQCLGVLLSVLGVALGGFDPSLLLVMLGIVVAGPTFFHSVLFGRYFESVSKRAYFFSVAMPAMIGVDILFTVKPSVVDKYPILWETLLLSVGSMTLVLNSVSSLLKNKTKSMLLYLSQAWIGAMFMLLASDSSEVQMALASISVFLVVGLMLHLEAERYSNKVLTLTTSLLLGLPCFVGFNVIFYTMRALYHVSPWMLAILIGSVIFQASAVIFNFSQRKARVEQGSLKINLKFALLILLNLICATAIHVLGAGHAMG